MTIREFHISAGHTFNLGSFESYKIEAGLTVTVNEGEDYDDLVALAQETLRNLVRETYVRQQRKPNAG